MNTERISDLSDLATAAEEKFRDAAISVRQPDGPDPCGHCLNCDVEVERRLRWCSVECRDDWEEWHAREQAALRNEG